MKAVTLNVVGGLIVAAAWLQGWASQPFLQDESHITWFIALTFILGMVCVFRRAWRGVRWLAFTMILMGLFGTLVGIRAAMSGVDVDTVSNVEAIKPMVASLVTGTSTAVLTTLVGIMCSAWLGFCRLLLSDEPDV